MLLISIHKYYNNRIEKNIDSIIKQRNSNKVSKDVEDSKENSDSDSLIEVKTSDDESPTDKEKVIHQEFLEINSILDDIKPAKKAKVEEKSNEKEYDER